MLYFLEGTLNVHIMKCCVNKSIRNVDIKWNNCQVESATFKDVIFMEEPFVVFGKLSKSPTIPITDSEVVYKNHLVDMNEFFKVGIPPEWGQLVPNRYNRWVRAQKEIEESKGKCPFGFGK